MVDVRTQPGQLYTLQPGQHLLYGQYGIELKLSSRNMRRLRDLAEQGGELKDEDNRGTRFEVRAQDDGLLFEVSRGQQVLSPKSYYAG